MVARSHTFRSWPVGRAVAGHGLPQFVNARMSFAKALIPIRISLPPRRYPSVRHPAPFRQPFPAAGRAAQKSKVCDGPQTLSWKLKSVEA